MYKFSAKVKKGNAVISHTEFDNSDFTFELSEKKGVIKGILKAKADMVMKDLEIETTRNFEKDDLFFANGYQSWSTSREYCRYDTTKDILPLGKKLGGFAAYACGIMSDYSFGDYYGKTGDGRRGCPMCLPAKHPSQGDECKIYRGNFQQQTDQREHMRDFHIAASFLRKKHSKGSLRTPQNLC